MIELLYYLGFAFLGWWLRSQGLAAGQAPGKPPAAIQSVPLDRDMLLAILKMLLERQGLQLPGAPGIGPGTIFHVPVEVSASPKAPAVSNGA
ncbi:MAG: hypothetical protein AB7K24_13595 [Gemmataceae bacterium]